jgi:hypothetical protein
MGQKSMRKMGKIFEPDKKWKQKNRGNGGNRKGSV